MNTYERIKFLIDQHYNSNAEFERDMGLKPTTVNNWRRGLSDGFLKIIPELAIKLKTSSAYLLCETDDPTPPDQDNPTIDIDVLKLALRISRLRPNSKDILQRTVLVLEQQEAQESALDQ